MFTENVCLAITAAISFVTVALFLIAVVRYGFRIEVGWLYCKIHAETPKFDEKKFNKDLDSRVRASVEVHLAGMESYKDNVRHIDDTTKAIIAHKIADMEIEGMDNDFSKSELLALAVKINFLLLNSENHYLKHAQSYESLKSYILEKYGRLCRILDKYSDNKGLVRYNAYIILRTWWDIIRSALLKAEQTKLEFFTNSMGVFDDTNWKQRIKDDLETRNKITENLTKSCDIYDLVCDYVHNETVVTDKDAFFSKSGVVDMKDLEK